MPFINCILTIIRLQRTFVLGPHKQVYSPIYNCLNVFTFDYTTVVKSVREKGRDLTKSCGKKTHTHRKTQKATWQRKMATKTFDYTFWWRLSFEQTVLSRLYNQNFCGVFVICYFDRLTGIYKNLLLVQGIVSKDLASSFSSHSNWKQAYSMCPFHLNFSRNTMNEKFKLLKNFCQTRQNYMMSLLVL